MGFSINEEIVTKLHYKDVVLIGMAFGMYQDKYKDEANDEVLVRMRNLVNRLGTELYDYKGDELKTDNIMDKEAAEVKLEQLVKNEIWESDSHKSNEFVDDYDELVEWCECHDDSVTLILDDTIDVSKVTIHFYGVEDNERDTTGFIILTGDNKVFSYGYSGD